jgi:hypothetical protein
LIRVEEGIDYVADWYLKTEDKEDTLRIYCADDNWMESKKPVTTEQQFQKKFAML